MREIVICNGGNAGVELDPPPRSSEGRLPASSQWRKNAARLSRGKPNARAGFRLGKANPAASIAIRAILAAAVVRASAYAGLAFPERLAWSAV